MQDSYNCFMDATPDYSKCSLRELRDVAARINREKFPDRTALVLREIERHETLGDDAATAKARNRAPVTQNNFAEAIYVVGGAFVGFLAGIVWLSMASIDMNPDSPNGVLETVAAIIVGAFAGKFGAKMHKRIRNGEP